MPKTNQRIYEVSFIMKKGDEPKVTHVLADSKEAAAQKILERKKALSIVEVFAV